MKLATPRRLEARIVALFLSLLLGVQLSSFFFIRSVIGSNAENSIAAELKTGERVLRRLLLQQAEKRADAAVLLAQDYGFKQAVGLPLAEAGTVETIQDALRNQGDRIGASVVAYFNNDLKLVAATRADAGSFAQFLKQKTVATPPSQLEDELQVTQLDGRVYQVVAVPVRTPAPVGWIMMGFLANGEALNDLKTLSDLQGIVVRREHDRWVPLFNSLTDADNAASLSAQAPDSRDIFHAEVAGERWRGRLLSLPQAAGSKAPELGIVLLRSYDSAVAPFVNLQLILLALTLLGAAIFAVLSVLLARRISGPLKTLRTSAEKLGQGDYGVPIVRQSPDEIGDLAVAFESMRQGIRAQIAKVDRLAYWDELTGLPNRAQFRARLEEQLAIGRPLAVLMLDLDRFKHVNDVLGQEFGDSLLVGVAERLQALCNSRRALLARLAGDEFALLLEHADESIAIRMAQDILLDFQKPLRIDVHTVDLSAGVGIALYPQHGGEAAQLLVRAELAMYAAKQRQCGFLVYTAELDAGSQESLSLLSDLRRAIDDNELRLYLQPKIDIKTGLVVGAEALVRWQHPQRGLVPPMQFVPFAEQTGFIRNLSAWVLGAAARAWRELADGGVRLRISVNLSTRDLLDQDLPQKIAALIFDYEVEPMALCLEITESAIMDDPQRAQTTLEHLSAMGFKLSIDDFGTGYSSLAYLKRLPVNELKIDKSFVMAMEADIDDAKIVRSTIELAHNLGLTVVAEGVETAKAWKLLAALGCDEGQGYFMGKPMPYDQFLPWMAGWQLPELGSDMPDTVLSGLL
ncbi:MAG TPA: EAL domain-containing protein [Burkholderiaceae bacterium]|jgi:diguanylate cyclase (GGDEF)-like protein